MVEDDVVVVVATQNKKQVISPAATSYCDAGQVSCWITIIGLFAGWRLDVRSRNPTLDGELYVVVTS